MLATAAGGLALPLMPVAGTPVGWALLPFLLAALIGLDWAIRRNLRDAGLSEEIRIWPDLVTVVRRDPRGAERRWHAHPLWVEPRLSETPHVEHYLTLRGGGREIELGAFLTPHERAALYREICAALGRACSAS